MWARRGCLEGVAGVGVGLALVLGTGLRLGDANGCCVAVCMESLTVDPGSGSDSGSGSGSDSGRSSSSGSGNINISTSSLGSRRSRRTITAGVNTGVGLGDQFTHCGSDPLGGSPPPHSPYPPGGNSSPHLSALGALLQHRIRTSKIDQWVWDLVRARLGVESEWHRVGGLAPQWVGGA